MYFFHCVICLLWIYWPRKKQKAQVYLLRNIVTCIGCVEGRIKTIVGSDLCSERKASPRLPFVPCWLTTQSENRGDHGLWETVAAAAVIKFTKHCCILCKMTLDCTIGIHTLFTHYCTLLSQDADVLTCS